MVVAEREIHHRADDDLAVHGDRALLDGVHAEDAALRRIEDRRAEQGAVDAAVGDGEDAAAEVFDADLALARLRWRSRRCPARSRRRISGPHRG